MGGWKTLEAARSYRKRTAIRRQRFMNMVKTTAGCLDCGTTEGVLHFDHRPDEEKLFDIGSSFGHSLKVMLAEIEKCDVRCISCHIRRHSKERWASGRGRGRPKQEFCKRGHSMENAIICKGNRSCRVCTRANERRAYALRKARKNTESGDRA